MGAISAFSAAVGTLRRNAVLFGVAFVVSLANVALTGLPFVVPTSVVGVTSIVASGVALLVAPFVAGGLLAMAHEGLDGATGVATFASGGRANYPRILGAMVLLGVLFAALGVAIAVAVLLVTGLVAGSASTPTGFVLPALVGLIGLLASSLILFVVQFYAPAIVVSGLDVGSAFQRSADLVRENPVSVLGYTTILVVLGSFAGVSGAVLSVAGSAYASPSAMGPDVPEVGVVVVAVLAAVTVVVTTVVAAFGSTYQVAFYEGCVDDQ